MKLSVIIPVYNAETTLRRCVDSLLSQQYNDTELLLVNDGSADGSGAICAEYARRDPRVRFIDKENGGVSSARNAGLDVARGDFVAFVDSDDYVSDDFFRSVEDAIRDQSWDLIRFVIAPAGKSKPVPSAREWTPYRSRKELFPVIIDEICNKTINSPCAKIYRREILEREGLRFPLGASVAEDRAMNIRYSMYMKNYLVSGRTVYFVNTDNRMSLSRKRHADLPEQFAITGNYVLTAIRETELPDEEREQYLRAYHFGVCRGVYKRAKDLRGDHVSWFRRQKTLWRICGEINGKRMRYPKTKYCRAITLPVRLRQTWLIDLVAGQLVRSGER